MVPDSSLHQHEAIRLNNIGANLLESGQHTEAMESLRLASAMLIAFARQDQIEGLRFSGDILRPKSSRTIESASQRTKKKTDDCTSERIVPARKDIKKRLADEDSIATIARKRRKTSTAVELSSERPQRSQEIASNSSLYAPSIGRPFTIQASESNKQNTPAIATVVLYNLALVNHSFSLRRRHPLDRAASLYKLCLRISMKSRAAISPVLIATLHNLSQICYEQNQPRAANNFSQSLSRVLRVFLSAPQPNYETELLALLSMDQNAVATAA